MFFLSSEFSPENRVLFCWDFCWGLCWLTIESPVSRSSDFFLAQSDSWRPSHDIDLKSEVNNLFFLFFFCRGDFQNIHHPKAPWDVMGCQNHLF